MAKKVNRLSKVARELNVGISTIVEYLDSKGMTIESSPNTKLDENMYGVLLKEYGDEKALKEAAKRKEKEEVVEVKETITIKGNNKFAPKKEEVKEEPKAEEVKPEPTTEPEVVAEAKTEKPAEEENTTGPKVVDKIDLSALNLKTRPSKKTKPEKEKKADKKTAKPAAKKKAEKETPKKVEPVKEVEKEKPVKEEVVVEHHKTSYEKLDAPTVLGKIELPKPAPKKPKPVASSSADPANKKKKRKRISPAGGGGVGRPVKPGAGGRFGKPSGKPGGRFGGKSGGKREPKPELTEEQVQKQIQETLARLSNKGKNKSAKFRRNKRDDAALRAHAELELAEIEKSILKVTEFVTANELANMMGVSVNDIISSCMSLGMFVSINQRLDADTLTLVAEEFNHTVEFINATEEEVVLEEEDKEGEAVSRHPIVTVMGHVDHGKTSLLDHIRKANVIAGEAGGITQHIGAYEVTLEESGKKMTFLDTPGHEAFTAMRARGAKVTDIAIIVVAADDAVMPQTKEAINHAQAAGVPFIIAINKCDLPGANPEKVKTDLSQMNVLVEDWGGKIQCQEVSAKKGTGVYELLEKVLLEAEMLELTANPNKRANGAIIESSLDKGRGYLATILVQAGTLKVGDNMLAGQYTGKVKAMFNERGQKITSAGPATPVQMLGLNGAPTAGDNFNILTDEREARDIATKRSQLSREQGVKAQKTLTLDEIGRRIAVGDFKELNIILKGDVDGSIEALSDSLQKLSTDEIQVNVIHKSVGQITDSDVLLASASQAIIIGFQVRPSGTARKIADREEVDIRLYSIIYDAINDVKEAMEGMLSPDIKEEIVGNIEIRETFKISKVGTIAGCYVTDGTIGRKTTIRLIREGIVIYEGALGSLKRFKDDVAEVKAGYECGLNIDKFNDIKVGDVIEGYETREIKKKLFKD